MKIIHILLVALGLSMDAFSVSVTSGVQIKAVKYRHAFLIALVFGVFQALMPLLGAALGIGLLGFLSSFDHWLAFAILSFIGGKMIYESRFLKENEKKSMNPLDPRVLLLLAVATSIDALAVGFTITLISQNIFQTAAIIGLVTFLLCFAGVIIGDRFGHFFESKIEILGGLMLIAVGLKILVEHLMK